MAELIIKPMASNHIIIKCGSVELDIITDSTKHSSRIVIDSNSDFNLHGMKHNGKIQYERVNK